jgi:putative flippase GtrA
VSKNTLTSLIRFIALSGLSFSLTVGLTAALHEVSGIAEELAYASTIIVAFFVNFLCMRYWVSISVHRPVKRQLGEFAVATAGFRGAEYSAFLLVHTVLEVHYLIAIVSIQFVSFVVKFVFYRAFVFRSADSAPGNVEHDT